MVDVQVFEKKSYFFISTKLLFVCRGYVLGNWIAFAHLLVKNTLFLTHMRSYSLSICTLVTGQDEINDQLKQVDPKLPSSPDRLNPHSTARYLTPNELLRLYRHGDASVPTAGQVCTELTRVFTKTLAIACASRSPTSPCLCTSSSEMCKQRKTREACSAARERVSK
jgi:hypothetical protein